MRIDRKDITPPARERIFEYTIVLTVTEAERLMHDIGQRAYANDSFGVLYGLLTELLD